MQKLLIAISLLAVVALASAQDHHGSRGGGGGGGHAMSHGGGHGSHGSFGGGRPSARTGGGSGHNHSSFSAHGAYGHGSTHAYSSGHNFGGGRRGVAGRFRPGGVGHNRAWFSSRGWHSGPAYIHPIYSGIYIGYRWGIIPPHRVLIWMQDPATGQYYQAYYYPEYGYYAWYNSPLVAVGVYRPGLAITVAL